MVLDDPQDAYQANMAKVQEKLKVCIENQSMKSLDRLSEALDTTTTNNDQTESAEPMETDVSKTMMSPAIDALETAGKGENKVLVSKHSRRKLKHSYRMKAVERKISTETETKAKPKPRFYCAF
jgi:hypothetical protein